MEECYIPLNNKNINGEVAIHTKVLEVVSSIATMQVEGIAKMHNKLTRSITDVFTRSTHGKGVEIDTAGEKTSVDVYIDVYHGYSLHHIAKEVQNKVQDAITSMTEMKNIKVNVHVVAVVFQNKEE